MKTSHVPGFVSTFAAMARVPEEFDGARCLVTCQPITPAPLAAVGGQASHNSRIENYSGA